MRRTMTLRSVLANDLAGLNKAFAALEGSIPADKRNLFESIQDQMQSFGDFAVLSAAEAPAPDSAKFLDFVAGSSPEQIEAHVRKYLMREIPLLKIDVPTEQIVDRLIDGLKSDAPLDQIKHDVIKAIPDMEAPAFNGQMIETVLREAIGLDGRTPMHGESPDIAASTAFFLRMTLGAQGHPISGLRAQEAMDLPELSDLDSAEVVLEDIAETASANYRDAAFYVGVSHIADEVAERIAMLTGQPMPAEVRGALHLAIDRLADKAAPQLTVSFEPEI